MEARALLNALHVAERLKDETRTAIRPADGMNRSRSIAGGLR